MSRLFVTIVVSLVIIAAAFYGYQNYLAPPPAPTPSSLAFNPTPSAEVVTATGMVVPIRSANLGFKIGGRLIEVRAGEGDNVKQGAVLARLDDAIWQKQIAQAQTQVAIGQQGVLQAQAQVP